MDDHALVHEQTQRLMARLEADLELTVVVEQAVGILMSLGDASEAQARQQLRALSQRVEQELVVVARTVVDHAVRRHTPSRPSPAAHPSSATRLYGEPPCG